MLYGKVIGAWVVLGMSEGWLELVPDPVLTISGIETKATKIRLIMIYTLGRTQVEIDFDIARGIL
jgi:hypothetical protein